MADIAYSLSEETAGRPTDVVTLKRGLHERWGERLRFVPLDPRRHARGEGGVPEPEVVVLVIGEPTSLTGERIGRATLRLPEPELENLRLLKRLGKKVVSVVYAGRPVLLDEVEALSDAVLMAWYPGTMGGEALGERSGLRALLCAQIPEIGERAKGARHSGSAAARRLADPWPNAGRHLIWARCLGYTTRKRTRTEHENDYEKDLDPVGGDGRDRPFGLGL